LRHTQPKKHIALEKNNIYFISLVLVAIVLIAIIGFIINGNLADAGSLFISHSLHWLLVGVLILN
jgi:uncharacterized membrane protein YkgB